MRLSLTILLFAFLSGCGIELTQPAPEKERFLLPEPPAQVAPAARPREGALRIGRFGVIDPFEREGLVWRESELEYRADYYNEFFSPPGTLIRSRVAAYLAEARPFQRVLAEERLGAPWELRGTVTALYGDLREKGRPAAVMAIHFYLVREENGEVVFDRVYRERVALPNASPEALVRGYGDALYRILGALSRDLAAQ